jgi:hypothetical protein
VIRDIWRLREELDLIKSVNYAQWESLDQLRQLLKPSSFRITTQARANRFIAESDFLAHAQKKRSEAQKNIFAMNSRLANINTYVVQMLEIQQESNGNALIVFTLVTIIFLPLSWATSYLGMNTSDIRNMESAQWIFWTIAVPVTSFVIGLSLLVVLKGEAIRELLIRKRSKRFINSERGLDRTSSRVLTALSTVKIENDEKRGWGGFQRRRVFHKVPSQV